MGDSFFSRLDGAAVRELLMRTELRDAAVFAVGASRRIESCNEAAARLAELHPLEEIDPFLSAPARDALIRCIETGTACSLEESVDGIPYGLELIPHRDGALLAYLRHDRAAYDGSLRILQSKGAYYLGLLMMQTDRLTDSAAAQEIRQQCMRLYRLLSHSDELHDPMLSEQLELMYCDLSALCRDAAKQAERYTSTHCAPISVDVPENCLMLVSPPLIRRALYNLLTNALRVTPADGSITISLRSTDMGATITVADTGPGLEPAQFEELLTRWRRITPLDDFWELTRSGTPLGLGLPLVNQIAYQHGGCLLLSPHEGGGSELHFNIARQHGHLEQSYLHSPAIIEDGYSIEDIEFSVLD